MDLRELAHSNVKGNFADSKNTMFMVVICQLSHADDIGLSPPQLPAAYTYVRIWQEVSDFLDIHGDLKEPKSTIEVKVHHRPGRIGRRVYVIMYTRANNHGSHVWLDFVPLLLLKWCEVETWTPSGNISHQYSVSYRDGDGQVCNLTGEGNPCLLYYGWIYPTANDYT
jgi:hypothetical protein